MECCSLSYFFTQSHFSMVSPFQRAHITNEEQSNVGSKRSRSKNVSENCSHTASMASCTNHKIATSLSGT